MTKIHHKNGQWRNAELVRDLLPRQFVIALHLQQRHFLKRCQQLASSDAVRQVAETKHITSTN